MLFGFKVFVKKMYCKLSMIALKSTVGYNKIGLKLRLWFYQTLKTITTQEQVPDPN